MSANLQISPGYSRLLLNYLISVHGLSLLAAVSNDLPALYQGMLGLALCVSFCFSCKRYVLTPPGYTLRYNDSDGWQLAGDEQPFRAIMLSGATVSTRLVSIIYIERQSGRKEPLLIFRDSLSTEQYRRLRVALTISTIH